MATVTEHITRLYLGNSQSGTVLRDTNTYPTQSAQFLSDVNAGLFDITLSNGTVIPGNSGSQGVTVATNTGMASKYNYSTDNGGTLQILGANSGTNRLKIETVSGQVLTLSNSQNSSIPYNTFVGNGNSGDSNFPLDWTFWGVTPNVAIVLTFEKNGATDSVTFTPVAATNKALTSAPVTIPVAPTTPTTPTTPAVPSGNVGTANLPAWETFDYSSMSTNDTPVWTNTDNRTNADGLVGRYVPISNGTLTVRISENGGAPLWIAGPDGKNRINQHNTGTETGLALYRGRPTTTNPGAVISHQWAEVPQSDGSIQEGVSNNPLQTGNDFQQMSEVIALRKTGNRVDVKTKMRNWAVSNEYTDVILETATLFDATRNNVVHVYAKVNCNRTDFQGWNFAHANEAPYVYTNLENRVAAWVNESGNVQFQDTFAYQVFNQYHISPKTSWVARVESASMNAQGIGLWADGLHKAAVWSKSIEEGGNDLANGCSYMNDAKEMHFDWNGVYYFHYAYIVGTTAEIQSAAESLGDKRNTFTWKFNSQNGRGYFRYDSGKDTGFPTPADGVIISRADGNTGPIRFYSPFYAMPASSAPTLYMRVKNNSNQSSWNFNYTKLGQGEAEAEGASQRVDVNIPADGGWHTIAITPGWSGAGLINYYSLRTNSLPGGQTIQVAWVNTANQEPAN